MGPKRLRSEESDPINIPAGNDLRSFLELTPDGLTHFPEAKKAEKLGTYILFSTERTLRIPNLCLQGILASDRKNVSLNTVSVFL